MTDAPDAPDAPDEPDDHSGGKRLARNALGLSEDDFVDELRRIAQEVSEIAPRADAVVRASTAHAFAQAWPPTVVPPTGERRGGGRIEATVDLTGRGKKQEAGSVDLKEAGLAFAGVYGMLAAMLDEDPKRIGATAAATVLLMLTLVIVERLRRLDD